MKKEISIFYSLWAGIIIFWTILLVTIILSGCTVQFKAKEIELEGHSNTSYEFRGFAWTEKPTNLQDPVNTR